MFTTHTPIDILIFKSRTFSINEIAYLVNWWKYDRFNSFIIIISINFITPMYQCLIRILFNIINIQSIPLIPTHCKFLSKVIMYDECIELISRMDLRRKTSGSMTSLVDSHIFMWLSILLHLINHFLWL